MKGRMSTYTLNGEITEDPEWYELKIGGVLVSRELYHELNLNGKEVQVNWWVSDEPIKDKEEITEKFLNQMYSGEATSDHYDLVGTSWTGQYGVHEEFTVGGHDLIRELSGYVGKYCLLEINYK